MICNDVLKMLTVLNENRGKNMYIDSRDQLLLHELEKRGFVSQLKMENFDSNELSEARSKLVQLYSRENSTLAPESASQQEQELRNRILALSELAANRDRSILINGINYGITYKGNELVRNLIPRIKRIGNKQLEEFEKEMSSINNTFVSWAKRSFEILQYLSPRVPGVEEIHCRSAVIGLSSRPESVKEISNAFLFALESTGKILNNKDRALSIAECIIISLKNLSRDSISSSVSKFYDLEKLAGKYASNEETALDCALLLYPHNNSIIDNQRSLESAFAFAMKMDSEINFDVRLNAALLIEVMGMELNEDCAGKFNEYFNKLKAPVIPARNTGIASALIVIGIFEGQNFYSRFNTALEYLSKFSDEPMFIPAAMISHLSPEIEETLDTLRHSSSAIARQKLSIGGLENLSLGMKMLLQSSVISSLIAIPSELRKEYVLPDEIIPLQTLGLLSISMLPVALITFTAFHDLSIHRFTISDYSFHPVHTNFSYG